MTPAFCTPFDERLAGEGPPSIFVVDHEGNLRFDSEWTRDAYSRVADPREPGWRWVLARDRGSGYVQLVLSTSPELVHTHPRLDLRVYVDRDEAVAALRALGRPPIASGSW